MKNAVIVILSLLSFAVSVHAYENNIDFRCGNLFVEEGVHTFQVLEHCGKPLYREFYKPADCCDEVLVEKWVYGPEAGYYYILFFEVGVLKEVDAYRDIW